jgi:hypothetical protein
MRTEHDQRTCHRRARPSPRSRERDRGFESPFLRRRVRPTSTPRVSIRPGRIGRMGDSDLVQRVQAVMAEAWTFVRQ